MKCFKDYVIGSIGFRIANQDLCNESFGIQTYNVWLYPSLEVAVWVQLTNHDFTSSFLKGQELVNSLDLGGLIVGFAQEAHFKAKTINGMNGFNLCFYSNIETTLSVLSTQYLLSTTHLSTVSGGSKRLSYFGFLFHILSGEKVEVYECI